MSLILNIDTCGTNANIFLSENGKVVQLITNTTEKDHASFLHPAITALVNNTARKLTDIAAVSVIAGPGSYTGIRVGMATAKGICMALAKPLITINSLEMMAKDVILNNPEYSDYLFSPMLDARRMEVYTAVYDKSLKEILRPSSIILNKNTISYYFSFHKTIFFGAGAEKLKKIAGMDDIFYIQNVNLPQALAELSHRKFSDKVFSDLIYSEPFYLKEFYNGFQ